MDKQASRDADREACKDLVIRFYRYLDLRDYANLDALMARDGVYVRPSGRSLLAGPALLADFETGSKTVTLVHLITNLIVDVSDQRATVQGYMTVFQHDNGAPRVLPLPLGSPMSIRDLGISLHRCEGPWRIERVNNVLLFREKV